MTERIPLTVVRYQDTGGAVDEMVEIEKVHRILLQETRERLQRPGNSDRNGLDIVPAFLKYDNLATGLYAARWKIMFMVHGAARRTEDCNSSIVIVPRGIIIGKTEIVPIGCVCRVDCWVLPSTRNL